MSIREYYSRSSESPQLKILSMISAVWVSKIIYFGVKKGIFDRLGESASTLAELSECVTIREVILDRILQGYVHLDLLERCGDNTYKLTKLGRLLSQNEENNFHHMALLWGEEFYAAWGKGLEALDTNKPAFDTFYSMNLFTYLSNNEQVAQSFDHAMFSMAKVICPAVVEKISLDGIKTVTDVGGGGGFLLEKLLTRYPSVTGVLFDLPHVIKRIQAGPSSILKIENIHHVGGSFFESVPLSDVHILSNILHDWNDEEALKILNKVRAAKNKGSLLFIVEMLLDPLEEPHLARSTDLNMMMLTGGRERTRSEMNELLAASHFSVKEIDVVNQMTCVIKAVAE